MSRNSPDSAAPIIEQFARSVVLSHPEAPMIALSKAATRLSMSLLLRGVLLVLLGITAIAWPAGALVGAIFMAAALLALSGGYEIFLGCACATRRRAG
jgi:uncharacterized membrane protein HdeD (DUF308 family)